MSEKQIMRVVWILASVVLLTVGIWGAVKIDGTGRCANTDQHGLSQTATDKQEFATVTLEPPNGDFETAISFFPITNQFDVQTPADLLNLAQDHGWRLVSINGNEVTLGRPLRTGTEPGEQERDGIIATTVLNQEREREYNAAASNALSSQSN
ncbi:MAG TPA: hypothetical protein VGY56_10600 [Verrucomicrobiae bacterium]|nr:hypothetical protein [Verrucomicrobiae bacterium]